MEIGGDAVLFITSSVLAVVLLSGAGVAAKFKFDPALISLSLGGGASVCMAVTGGYLLARRKWVQKKAEELANNRGTNIQQQIQGGTL